MRKTILLASLLALALGVGCKKDDGSSSDEQASEEKDESAAEGGTESEASAETGDEGASAEASAEEPEASAVEKEDDPEAIAAAPEGEAGGEEEAESGGEGAESEGESAEGEKAGKANVKDAISDMEKITKQVCACEDRACLQKAMTDAQALGQKYKGQQPGDLSPEQKKKVQALGKKMMGCTQRISGAGGAGGLKKGP